MLSDKKFKGLGLAINKKIPQTSGAKPMPYTPGQGGGAKTMPLKPGQGAGAKTMPYRPNKPRLDPVRKMSYDAPVMDSLGDPVPPGYATMEYNPQRDGGPTDGWENGGSLDVQPYDDGQDDVSKQVEEDAWNRWPYNEDNEYEARDQPSEEELEQWKEEWRRKLAAEGYAPEEIESILENAAPKSWQD